MADISDWSATAANNNATPPDGFPEGQTPSSVNDGLRELMAAIRRWYEDAQWVDLGLTHTRTGGSTFTLSGDYTATYQVGRRVKMVGSATGYGTISASSYSAPNTTITIAEANVPASLASVSISVISPTNGAFPGVINNGPIDFAGGHLRVTGSSAPAAGSGLELSYNTGSNTGTVTGYDRTGAAYRDVAINGLSITYQVKGVTGLIIQDAGAGLIDYNFQNPATSTSASAGGASALPAAPVGYIQILVNGTARKLPYYAV